MAGDAGAASSPSATPYMTTGVGSGGPVDDGCCASAASASSDRTPISNETGRLRRLHLRGHANIRKRLLVHACGLNLGLLMRRLAGFGTPRSLQGRARAFFDALRRVLSRLWRLVSPAEALVARRAPDPSSIGATTLSHLPFPFSLQERPLSKAC